eukprot:m.61094 g.61094  ORF g.61094 m.61094 type:complete len:483 (+) comp11377_c0_seq2:98-1546(+)
MGSCCSHHREASFDAQSPFVVFPRQLVTLTQARTTPATIVTYRPREPVLRDRRINSNSTFVVRTSNSVCHICNYNDREVVEDKVRVAYNDPCQRPWQGCPACTEIAFQQHTQLLLKQHFRMTLGESILKGRIDEIESICGISADSGYLDEILHFKAEPMVTSDRVCLQQSPLYLACELGSIQIVDTLLSWKADPNFAGVRNESTCLIAAIAEPGIISHNSLARLLINARANVNTHTYMNVTPLHKAVACGDVNLVTDLLLHGADPRGVWQDGARLDNGATPLHEACFRGYLHIAQRLMICDANPKQRDFNSMSPLDLARQWHRSNVVAWFTYITSIGWYTMYPLQLAVDARLPQFLKFVLRKGGDPRCFTVGTQTSLQLAKNTNIDRYPSAKPPCKETMRLLQEALRRWSPATYYLYGPRHRKIVFTLYLIDFRMRSQQDFARHDQVNLLLPCELWMEVFDMLPRYEYPEPSPWHSWELETL